MIAVAIITALALIAWKALDNHERRSAREHERCLTDAYARALADYEQWQGHLHNLTQANTLHAGRIQALEQWQQQKQRDGFATRGKS